MSEVSADTKQGDEATWLQDGTAVATVDDSRADPEVVRPDSVGNLGTAAVSECTDGNFVESPPLPSTSPHQHAAITERYSM